ncbi:MAG: hypothetical protein V1773_13700 [bacterium]
MNTKVNDYIDDLILFKPCYDFDWLQSHGFEMTKYEEWVNSETSTTGIEVFNKENKTAVRIINQVETQSEGTLTYQALWIDPQLEDFFNSFI